MGAWRRIFWLKKRKVTLGLRKLNIKEHDLYSLLNVIRKYILRSMRWAADEVRIREIKNAYTILIGISEKNRQL
jgi:hypothetical protein